MDSPRTGLIGSFGSNANTSHMSDTEITPIGMDESLNCPLCGYDLRGLTSPRCPECGHEYDIEAIRSAKHHGIGWLVETERQHPFRAAVRTSFRSLLPLSFVGFWKRFPPAAPLVASRLRWFAIVWIVAAFAWEATSVIAFTVERYNSFAAPIKGLTPRTPTYQLLGLQQFTFQDAFEGWSSVGERLIFDLILLAWPLLTFVYLNVFGITLKRAGIGAGHLWRVAIYPLPLAILVTFSIRAIRPFFGTSMLEPDGPEVYVALLVTTLLHSVGSHLDYLKIRQALAQAFLVWLLCWLTIAAVLSVFFNP
jgi:hypothetical protein